MDSNTTWGREGMQCTFSHTSASLGAVERGLKWAGQGRSFAMRGWPHPSVIIDAIRMAVLDVLDLFLRRRWACGDLGEENKETEMHTRKGGTMEPRTSGP